MATKLDPVSEKLQSRANNLAACIRRFLSSYQDALQQKHASNSLEGGDNKAADKAAKKGKAATKKPVAAATGKKAKAAKDPQVEAWATFMTELDERINKKKTCSLEDMYRAVGALPSLEQQILSSIIATTTAKMLPAMNEAVLAIKDSLSAAAAAHTFRQQQVPDAGRETAAAFRQRGLPADCALSAGYTAGQLLRGGYSVGEVVQSKQADLRHMRAAGISVQEVYDHLSEAAAALTGVEGACRLRQAGFSVQAVQAGAPDAALSMWDLKLAGYGSSAAAATAVQGSSQPGAANLHHSSCSADARGSISATGSSPSQPRCLSSASDVNYFRAAFKPLMQMQPGIDLPHLLIGTKDKQVLAGRAAAAEEAQTVVMLATNPVKLAQQRKRSGVGAVSGVATGVAGAVQQLASGLSSTALTAAARQPPHSRLRGVSGEH